MLRFSSTPPILPETARPRRCREAPHLAIQSHLVGRESPRWSILELSYRPKPRAMLRPVAVIRMQARRLPWPGVSARPAAGCVDAPACGTTPGRSSGTPHCLAAVSRRSGYAVPAARPRILRRLRRPCEKIARSAWDPVLGLLRCPDRASDGDRLTSCPPTQICFSRAIR